MTISHFKLTLNIIRKTENYEIMRMAPNILCECQLLNFSCFRNPNQDKMFNLSQYLQCKLLKLFLDTDGVNGFHKIDKFM